MCFFVFTDVVLFRCLKVFYKICLAESQPPEIKHLEHTYLAMSVFNPFTGNGAFWHHARLN